MRILLVEDEPILRAILCESLEDRGYQVQSAICADTAWDMIRHGHEFDILVTDVRMPGKLNGLDLARLALGERPDIDIVVISGFTSLERFDQRLGAFLSKPFTPTTLADTIAASRRNDSWPHDRWGRET